MPLPTYALTLPTPFGEAAFGVIMEASGRVRDIRLPLADLPESVYKLTYGAEWRDARAYFERLGDTLTYRIEAVLFMLHRPEELDGLATHFAEHGGARVPDSDYARYWVAHEEWRGGVCFPTADGGQGAP